MGLGDELELQALAVAAEHLDLVPGYIAMNISPATLLTAEAAELFDRLPVQRVLLELSEHDQVEDYDVLMAVLGPLRRRACASRSTTSVPASRRCATSCSRHPTSSSWTGA